MVSPQWFLPAAKHSRSITRYLSFPPRNHRKRAKMSKMCMHLAILSWKIGISDMVGPPGGIMSKHCLTNYLKNLGNKQCKIKRQLFEAVEA